MDKILSAGTIYELSEEASTKDTLQADAATATFVDITCAISSMSFEETEREQIDTTALCDTDTKSYIDGLKDQDTASADGFYTPSSDEAIFLQAAADSKENRILRTTYNDGVVVLRLARLQPFGSNVSVGDAVKTTFNFKLTGAKVITQPTP